MKHREQAQAVLRELIELNQWWSDIVAAQLTEDLKELRVPELAKKLSESDEELVQKRLQWARDAGVLGASEKDASSSEKDQ